MPKYKNVHELKAALDMDTMVNVATSAQSTRPKSKIVRTCDFCKKQARYDGKTAMGPWAYMCEEHHRLYGYNIKGLYTDLNSTE